MITQPDDIAVGDYLTIVGPKTIEGKRPQDTSPVEGLIYKVLGISLPFLAVESSGERGSLDVRRFSLTKLNSEYVTAMNVPRQIITLPDIPLVSNCATCGDRLVRRYTEEGYHRYCRTCDEYGEDSAATPGK